MTSAKPAVNTRVVAAPNHSTGRLRMPAEWERHDATWIAWPHHEPDWPGKLAAIPWVYAEIVRALHRHEQVEILCHDETVRHSAQTALEAHEVDSRRYRLHIVPTDRVWLRDSAPSFVWNEVGAIELVNWRFNGWAKYDNYERDEKVGEAIERITGLHRTIARRPDDGSWMVLEGGGLDVDGAGALLVTEEWLLSDVQVRNPGLTKADYEAAFAEYLGITETIWLGEGCVGDDTHGHIDDIARFAAPGVVLLAYEADADDANHPQSVDNLSRLENTSAHLRIVKLPYPRPLIMEGQRLPASYANFYIANEVVIVPTFNDPNDRVALDIIAREFPGREVVGIHAVDLVWGLGTLHCLTQQQAAPRNDARQASSGVKITPVADDAIRGQDYPEDALTAGSPGRAYTVVYDGFCNVCKRLVGLLAKWDKNGVLEILPSQTSGLHARYPWIPARAYLESVQVIHNPTGTTWQGAAAMETLLDVLPKGKLVSWTFSIPFARPLAEKFYRWFAKNRYHLGCGEHCQLKDPVVEYPE